MRETDILVVDDEPHIVRALSFIFSKAGYDIETARNGEEAEAKCREIAPKVVFLDLIMPKMDGFHLCRQLKSANGSRSPHIIILTCMGQEIDRENCMKAGADEFMTKPFSPREVLERVHQLLASDRG